MKAHSQVWNNFWKPYKMITYAFMSYWAYNKQIKISIWLQIYAQSTYMLNFDFFRKEPGTSLPTTFSAWFLRMSFMLYFTDKRNLIYWLPLLLEIFRNTFIAIICFQNCDVINFEINLYFLIKPFPNMIKIVRTKI